MMDSEICDGPKLVAKCPNETSCWWWPGCTAAANEVMGRKIVVIGLNVETGKLVNLSWSMSVDFVPVHGEKLNKRR